MLKLLEYPAKNNQKMKTILTSIFILLGILNTGIAQTNETTKVGVFRIVKPKPEQVNFYDTLFAPPFNSGSGLRGDYPEQHCTYVDVFIDERGYVVDPKILRSLGKKDDQRILKKVFSKTAFGMSNLEWNKNHTIYVCFDL